MKKIRAHIFVSGLVQGVFFRSNIAKKAKGLGITGWVRNLADGGVEIMFEGEKEKVEKIIEWARTGSLLAKIDQVKIEWQEYKGEFDKFEIIV